MANNNSNLIEKLLGGSGLNQVWVKVFSLVKILTGDVDVKNKGNLQKQIDDVRSDVEGIMDGTGDTGLVFADDTESEYDTAIGQVVSGKPLSVLFQYLKAALKSAYTLAQKAYNVAAGKNQARVFATVDALDEWLGDPDNLAQLHVGDNFYIVALDVPDYWWDGEQKQPLETQKVDMTTYDQAIAALQSADTKLNEDIGNLQNQIASFENTKSEIVSSGLGQAIGLTASSIWSQIVEKIKVIANRGAVSQALNCGGSYTIPQGYHNGSGKVTANSLASQTSANAGAAQILSGYNAWVNGSKINGSMANRGTLNWSGSNTTYGVPAGYYSGGTLDSRPSYNAGVAAADNRVNTNSQSYKSGYNAGVSAGQTAKRDSVTLSKIGPSDDDVTIQNYTFTATVGRCYVAAMAGDPGNFQNFSVSGATVLSNIYAGDTPPEGTQFVRMVTLKATSSSVTIRWTGGTGSTQPYMIVGRVD